MSLDILYGNQHVKIGHLRIEKCFLGDYLSEPFLRFQSRCLKTNIKNGSRYLEDSNFWSESL